MEVSEKLILHGFERKDLGEYGAVFVRCETPQGDKRERKIENSPFYHHGTDYESFLVSIPKPQPPQVTGAVLVERTSKSRYTVSAWVGARLVNFAATSTDEIVRAVADMVRAAREVGE